MHRLAVADEFRPVKEAELPEGFPGYTSVGEIEVKQYPPYRKASAAGPMAFWMLFAHIKSNGVAMTAPVELDYGDPSATEPREQSMSFLYERPDQGSAGRQGFVEVDDVPATTVLSIGCRGARTRASVDEARDKLLRWLDENKSAYRAAGPLRVLGYNSPFIPKEKQFYEVQISIEPAAQVR